jgi:hypothetical protein
MRMIGEYPDLSGNGGRWVAVLRKWVLVMGRQDAGNFYGTRRTSTSNRTGFLIRLQNTFGVATIATRVVEITTSRPG